MLPLRAFSDLTETVPGCRICVVFVSTCTGTTRIMMQDESKILSDLFMTSQPNPALTTCFRYIASGQAGHNADVIVWNFQDRTRLYRLSEHDHGVAFVAFSHDDRLLCSGGAPEDRKILVWDMSNGCIVAIVQHDPVPTTVAAWGGMVR